MVFIFVLAMGPREVNGDGIGYLKAIRSGQLYPGHLLYVPLLRGVCRLFGAHTLLACVLPCRIVSAIGAALAAVCCGRLGRDVRVGAGFAISAGVIGAGCDIESYAPALAAVLGTVLALRSGRDALAGVLLALAIGFHIENVLLIVPAIVMTRRPVLMVSMVGIVLVVSALLLGLRPSTLPQASHGFHYPLHLYTPAIALWGALRTLVFAQYPYEASWVHVIAPVIAAAGFVIALRPRRWFVSRTVTLAWLVPYSIVGVLFFPSDPERWLFVLPLFWLAVEPRVWVVLVLGAINVALWLPHARDTSAIEKAQAVASQLHANDLVIMPGHGWDESIALYADDVKPFPLVFHTAAHGGIDGMGIALDDALRTSRRVVSVRLEDPSPLGWKELAPFGVDRGNVQSILRTHGLVPGDEHDGVREWIKSR